MVPTLPSRRAMACGFTLLELIMVILILGGLAAVAMPRLVNLHAEAHRASVALTAAAFGAAVHLANAACTARNFAGRDNLPNLGTGIVDFNSRCFPSSTNGNNGNVNAARCQQVWLGVLAAAPSISTTAIDSTEYRAQGGGTTCTFTYREDAETLRRFTYSTATGAISLTNP